MKPTTPNSFSRSRAGGALMPVVVMIMSVSAGLAAMQGLSSQRLHTLQRSANRIKALAISEAGLHQAVRMLSENPEATETTGQVTADNDFSGGSFQVTLSHPPDTADGVFMLSSTGTYRDESRTTIATFLVTQAEVEEEEEPPPGRAVLGPFGPAAIFAGGQLTLSGGTDIYVDGHGAHANGSVVLSGGPVLHASYLSTNGSINMNGNPRLNIGDGEGIIHADGPVEIRGQLSAGTISSSTQITGNWGTNTGAQHVAPTVNYPNWYSPAPNVSIQQVDLVQPMSLPPLDVEAYKAYAQANGWYYEGNQQIGRSWLTKDIKDRTGEKVNNNRTDVVPAGGVMFVNGRVGLASDMEMVGMIIATGDITINGGSTLSNDTEYPAVVSTEGNIRINGGARLTQAGWVYAMQGSVTCNGGAEGLTGIIAAQNITLSGGYTMGQGIDASGFTWPGYEEEETGDEDAGGGGELELLSWIR